MDKRELVERHYSALILAIYVTKIFSYILAALSIGGALIILLGKTPGSGKWTSLGVLLAGGIYFLAFYLLSELIRLLLEINQRLKVLEVSAQPAKREIH